MADESAYIDFGLEADQAALIETSLDNIEARFPGWIPSENHLEVALIEEFARLAALVVSSASVVPKGIFREFGRDLVGITAIPGAPAGATVTITAVDSAGYVMPLGTRIGYRLTGDEITEFETTAVATIGTGLTSVTGVPIEAVEYGDHANGIPTGASFEMVDSLAWVSSIVSTSISSGGADPENDDAYLARLRSELELLAPRPILATDFATLAKKTPGVYRAVAIDGYNPANGTSNNERMVTVAAVDENGTGVPSALRTAIQADLDARRELNFVVNMTVPTYTDVNVAVTVKKSAVADSAVVATAVRTAVENFLDPALWAGGDEESPVWRLNTIVRYLEVAEVVNNVDGVDYITTTGGLFDLTVNGARVDLALAGVAPLPSPIGTGTGFSTVTVTVV